MSVISKFYSGRSVFITGGSGFIGKQIIEKLLRSCSEIEHIYMLMRPKDGEPVEKRAEAVLASPVFSRLHRLRPDFARKVTPIAGDITQDFLGISDADRQRLERNVSVVVHSAASLSFTEPLRVAVDMNVLGVQRMLSVCKKLPKLDALVHLSTAYSQVDKKYIEEEFYDPPVSPEKIIDMIKVLSDDELAVLTPHLLKKYSRPNTYTLSKAVGEQLIAEQRGHIPCSVVRPTIVTASCSEPFPGWVDNLTAANGIYAGYGTGMIRAVYTTKTGNKLDLVPVDMAANNVIVAAWQTAIDRDARNEIKVYNMSNEGTDNCYHSSFKMATNAQRTPLSMIRVRRSITCLPYWTANWSLYRYWTEVYVPLRCWTLDRVLQVTGRKPRVMQQYQKTRKLLGVLTYFTRNSFVWSTNNTKELLSKLDDDDKKEFNFDIHSMDVEKYYRDWWLGLRTYVFKDKKPEVDAAAIQDIAEPQTSVTEDLNLKPTERSLKQ